MKNIVPAMIDNQCRELLGNNYYPKVCMANECLFKPLYYWTNHKGKYFIIFELCGIDIKY